MTKILNTGAPIKHTDHARILGFSLDPAIKSRGDGSLEFVIPRFNRGIQKSSRLTIKPNREGYSYHSSNVVKINGHYTFLIVSVVGVLFFLALGVWQWHRGIEKEQLLASYVLRQKAPPVTLSRIRHSKNLSALPYYRAVLKGYFDEHRSLLLENQFYQHRVGCSVFTPFIVEPGQAILVYRGWVPMPEDRSMLPKIFTPTGIVTLTGTLWKSDPPRFHFGNEPTLPEKWPKRFQVLQWETLPPSPYAILPIGLWLDASLVGQGELPREALRITTISPARHYGYAALWVIIATVFGVLCGYIIHGDNEI